MLHVCPWCCWRLQWNSAGNKFEPKRLRDSVVWRRAATGTDLSLVTLLDKETVAEKRGLSKSELSSSRSARLSSKPRANCTLPHRQRSTARNSNLNVDVMYTHHSSFPSVNTRKKSLCVTNSETEDATQHQFDSIKSVSQRVFIRLFSWIQYWYRPSYY